MNLAVLGDRVFIRPDVVEAPASGLVLTDQQDASLTRGTVLAVGEGPELAHKAVERAMSALSKRFDAYIADDTLVDGVRAVAAHLKAEARQIVTNYEPEHLVMPGDRVLFAPDSGEELRCEGEIVFVMRESDILAVIE